jgi:hypothetical protein
MSDTNLVLVFIESVDPFDCCIPEAVDADEPAMQAR